MEEALGKIHYKVGHLFYKKYYKYLLGIYFIKIILPITSPKQTINLRPLRPYKNDFKLKILPMKLIFYIWVLDDQ